MIDNNVGNGDGTVGTEGIFSGFALWLVPSSSSSFSAVVKEEMVKLRNRNQGVASAEFGIHATLLAGLGDRKISGQRLEEVAREAIAQWRQEEGLIEGKGFKVNLEDVTTRGSYFQCILITLQKSTPLLRLNSITQSLVDQNFPPPSPAADSDYFPHISLLYASLSTSQAESQIKDMHIHGVFQTNPPNGINFRGFTEVTFVAVDVYDCTGKPEDWRKLYSIPL
ncbi:uncharacterized protein UTRI_02932 [Ustilago trichophora]|uniref:2',3'-cyclic-nucleotide 3'-phosphodiesterase n=1 Tax=Ustilago trichophora TaxID=86804 RepID=A0A5C3EQX9_9BASI|nr:uncharacterized protein UTRI_02932 [Ustilago trichophora]